MKSCLCAQSLPSFLAVPAGHLKTVPAPCRPCHKHSWRQSLLQHIYLDICQRRGLWTSHNVHLRACCNTLTYDILIVLSVVLRTHNWGFTDPFWLSTVLGDIQGFALLSFLEWDLQEESCTSFHAQNSEALSVEK